MSVQIEDGEEVQVGQEPTEEESFYVGLGDELLKRTLPFLNETLKQFITLSAALMGGSLVFGSALQSGFQAPILILFAFSLVAAVIGAIPFSATIPRRSPDQIKDAVERGITWKGRFLYFSVAFFFLGMFTALIGVLSKSPSPP